jgi:hypothetical protein
MELSSPDAETPDCGKLQVTVECSSVASPVYEASAQCRGLATPGWRVLVPRLFRALRRPGAAPRAALARRLL